MSEEQKEEIKFPVLDKGASAFFDDNALTFWVGIPLDIIEPLTAFAVLDRAKMDILTHYAMNQARIMDRQESRRRIIAPGILSKMKEVFVRASNGVGKILKDV